MILLALPDKLAMLQLQLQESSKLTVAAGRYRAQASTWLAAEELADSYRCADCGHMLLVGKRELALRDLLIDWRQEFGADGAADEPLCECPEDA